VRITRNERAVKLLDHEQVDMLLEHAEHLPIRDLVVVIDRWLLHADPDGAWREQRSAHVVAGNGQVYVSAAGGDALTAETLTKIFGEFVEREFRKDCESRRAEHGDRADDLPLPRTDAQRRFDALVTIFARAYAATNDGKMPDPVVNIVCDQRTLHDLLGRAGLVLANGERLDLDSLQREQIDAVLAEFVADPSSILTRRCETSSGQPVPPRLLIQALLTAQVRRVVLDSRSTVVDFGERKRLFTGNARVAATPLERFCSHPGCEVPADRSQIDHFESHSEGGRTDQANATPECGPHNRFKYDNRWRTTKADNGRTYSVRSDGTLVLFIGERRPEFKNAEDLARQREGLARLEELRARLRREAAYVVAPTRPGSDRLASSWWGRTLSTSSTRGHRCRVALALSLGYLSCFRRASPSTSASDDSQSDSSQRVSANLPVRS
jgi:hypothetical protein